MTADSGPTATQLAPKGAIYRYIQTAQVCDGRALFIVLYRIPSELSNADAQRDRGRQSDRHLFSSALRDVRLVLLSARLYSAGRAIKETAQVQLRSCTGAQLLRSYSDFRPTKIGDENDEA